MNESRRMPTAFCSRLYVAAEALGKLNRKRIRQENPRAYLCRYIVPHQLHPQNSIVFLVHVTPVSPTKPTWHTENLRAMVRRWLPHQGRLGRGLSAGRNQSFCIIAEGKLVSPQVQRCPMEQRNNTIPLRLGALHCIAFIVH